MKEKLDSFNSPEIPKYATVKDLVPTDEQEYVDPDNRYAHNDLYPASVLEIVKIQVEKVLVRDNTGDFWIPKSKLDLE